MDGLKPIQLRALGLLVSGKSFSDTAKELQISRSILYAWLEYPTFKAGYNILMEQLKQDTHSGLLALYQKAMKTVEGCMDSDNPQVAFKASLYVIDKVAKQSVGPTDPRILIKSKCWQETYNPATFERGRVFNEEVYKKLLEIYEVKE